MSELKRAIAAKEREVDYKITHYATFADTVEQLTPGDVDEFNSSDHMRIEVEKLLEDLRDLNRRLMNSSSSSGSSSNGAAAVSASVVQQHMGRLSTYTQDFQRVHARIRDAWNSAQLKRGASRTARRGANGEWSDEMQGLMDEHSAVTGANRAADRVLQQAEATHADLEAQRQRVNSIGSRLANVGRLVPGLNSLMTRIRGRRERDRYMLAGCIGSCIAFLLLYWFYF